MSTLSPLSSSHDPDSSDSLSSDGIPSDATPIGGATGTGTSKRKRLGSKTGSRTGKKHKRPRLVISEPEDEGDQRVGAEGKDGDQLTGRKETHIKTGVIRSGDEGEDDPGDQQKDAAPRKRLKLHNRSSQLAIITGNTAEPTPSSFTSEPTAGIPATITITRPPSLTLKSKSESSKSKSKDSPKPTGTAPTTTHKKKKSHKKKSEQVEPIEKAVSVKRKRTASLMSEEEEQGSDASEVGMDEPVFIVDAIVSARYYDHKLTVWNDNGELDHLPSPSWTYVIKWHNYDFHSDRLTGIVGTVDKDDPITASMFGDRGGFVESFWEELGKRVVKKAEAQVKKKGEEKQKGKGKGKGKGKEKEEESIDEETEADEPEGRIGETYACPPRLLEFWLRLANKAYDADVENIARANKSIIATGKTYQSARQKATLRGQLSRVCRTRAESEKIRASAEKATKRAGGELMWDTARMLRGDEQAWRDFVCWRKAKQMDLVAASAGVVGEPMPRVVVPAESEATLTTAKKVKKQIDKASSSNAPPLPPPSTMLLPPNHPDRLRRERKEQERATARGSNRPKKNTHRTIHSPSLSPDRVSLASLSADTEDETEALLFPKETAHRSKNNRITSPPLQTQLFAPDPDESESDEEALSGLAQAAHQAVPDRPKPKSRQSYAPIWELGNAARGTSSESRAPPSVDAAVLTGSKADQAQSTEQGHPRLVKSAAEEGGLVSNGLLDGPPRVIDTSAVGAAPTSTTTTVKPAVRLPPGPRSIISPPIAPKSFALPPPARLQSATKQTETPANVPAALQPADLPLRSSGDPRVGSSAKLLPDRLAHAPQAQSLSATSPIPSMPTAMRLPPTGPQVHPDRIKLTPISPKTAQLEPFTPQGPKADIASSGSTLHKLTDVRILIHLAPPGMIDRTSLGALQLYAADKPAEGTAGLPPIENGSLPLVLSRLFDGRAAAIMLTGRTVLRRFVLTEGDEQSRGFFKALVGDLQQQESQDYAVAFASLDGFPDLTVMILHPESLLDRERLPDSPPSAYLRAIVVRLDSRLDPDDVPSQDKNVIISAEADRRASKVIANLPSGAGSLRWPSLEAFGFDAGWFERTKGQHVCLLGDTETRDLVQAFTTYGATIIDPTKDTYRPDVILVDNAAVRELVRMIGLRGMIDAGTLVFAYGPTSSLDQSAWSVRRILKVDGITATFAPKFMTKEPELMLRIAERVAEIAGRGVNVLGRGGKGGERDGPPEIVIIPHVLPLLDRALSDLTWCPSPAKARLALNKLFAMITAATPLINEDNDALPPVRVVLPIPDRPSNFFAARGAALGRSMQDAVTWLDYVEIGKSQPPAPALPPMDLARLLNKTGYDLAPSSSSITGVPSSTSPRPTMIQQTLTVELAQLLDLGRRASRPTDDLRFTRCVYVGSDRSLVEGFAFRLQEGMPVRSAAVLGLPERMGGGQFLDGLLGVGAGAGGVGGAKKEQEHG